MLTAPSYAFDSPYHRQRRWTQPYTVRCLEAAFLAFNRPTSLLDVGCAEGVTVQYARRHAAIDAMGIDLAVPRGDPGLVCADLCQPVDLKRVFQWVLCWEVAEHLPESAADTLCDTLVRHLDPTGRVLFTAAVPGQRGPGHVNEQPWSYWAEKFATRGLTEAMAMSTQLRRLWLRGAPQTPWYGQNVHVLWRVA